MESESKIELVFPKECTVLVGREFGEQIYREQISGCVDGVYHKTLVLPDTVIDVDKSFVCGLFSEFAEFYGIGAPWLLFTFEAKDQVLKKKANELISNLFCMR